MRSRRHPTHDAPAAGNTGDDDAAAAAAPVAARPPAVGLVEEFSRRLVTGWVSVVA